MLLALDPAWRAEAVRWVLFFELATLGFFFVPALTVIKRSNGVTASLRLTRLTPSTALAVRVTTFAAAALVAAFVVLPVAGRGWSPDVLTGIALTSVLVSLLAVVIIGRATTLTAYVTRMPAVVVPLMGPALLHGTGLREYDLLALSPRPGRSNCWRGAGRGQW